jgi:hypothetical protein
MNQPPYCIISDRKAGTEPMVEASNDLTDGCLTVSRRRKEECRGIDRTDGPGGTSTEARQGVTCVTV